MQHGRAMKRRNGERGQTLILVALFIVVLIGMAALAIDTTALYVARSETQRAADAAALAGAKAFVDSGVTSDPTNATLRSLAANISTGYVNAARAKNKVQGVVPTLVSAIPLYPATNPGNPQITVTLQRTNLPTFFARIFGQSVARVTASATAEAYNSSNAGAGANMPPVAPKCVKPWLIPNADPRHSRLPFVTPAGVISNPGVSPTGILGEQLTLLNGCDNGKPTCNLPQFYPPTLTGPTTGSHAADGLQYLPTQLSAVTGACPSCVGGSNYERSGACCDDGNSANYACGTTAPGVFIDLSGTNMVNKTISSVECLTGASGPGNGAGQDEIGLGPGAQFPADTFGNFLASNGNDPIELRADSGPHSGQLVSTSQSIVTLAIFDNSVPIPLVGNLLGPVKIIGFMQAFVESTQGFDADVQIVVLNISGCGSNVNTALTPISGGGVSPVPVRLIHQ
jgi:hypothetical protein